MKKFQNNKIIVVGKLYEANKNNGPGAIIQSLLNEYDKMGINYETIVLNESNGKSTVLKKLIENVLLKKGVTVNVHTDGFILPFCVYVISRMNKKNGYYLSVHGIYNLCTTDHRIKSRFYSLLENIIYRKFPNIICVSEMLKDDLCKLFNRKESVYVIGNGTYATEYCGNRENTKKGVPFNFCMMGGIKENKGIFESLYFLNEYNLRTGKKGKLVICGNIESTTVYEKYEKLIKELNLSDCIFYHGIIKEKTKLYEIYRSSDLQLSLSKYDSFNVAVIEGMVLGCPCVVSSTSGASSLVEKYQGGWVVDITSDNIGNVVQDVIDTSEEAFDEKSQNALKVREKVAWGEIAKEYLAVMGYPKVKERTVL